MSIEWINECWNSFQLQLLDANHHSIVNQFKLSIALPKHIFTKNPKFIFKGLLISVSQVSYLKVILMKLIFNLKLILYLIDLRFF